MIESVARKHSAMNEAYMAAQVTRYLGSEKKASSNSYYYRLLLNWGALPVTASCFFNGED